MPVRELSGLETALCVMFLLLAPLAAAGLALMNAGLGRLRNAAHSMMASLCALAAAVCAYCAVSGSLSPAGPRMLMGVMGVSLGALIPPASGADRWRLAAVCVSAATFGGITFPLFAQWTWGGGWLAQLGYADPGGAGVIHAAGGMTALAMAWILGPRRGRYGPGTQMAVPGHNAVFVLFGCMLALAGWLGVNAAGALLFAGAVNSVDVAVLARVAVNTLLSASGAALATAAVTRWKYGKPDATLTANGWTAGLVASGAVSAFASPGAALAIGVAAGGMVTFSVELLDARFEIDDPGGAITVHGVGGLLGVLAAGILARGDFLAQTVGVATLAGCILPLSWALNALLNPWVKQRVAAEGERYGMDLHELGAGAYPEVMTHADDHMQR